MFNQNDYMLLMMNYVRVMLSRRRKEEEGQFL